MRGAVDFHDEPCTKAYEVHDVGTDGVLATESMTGQATGPEAVPEDCFGVGFVPPKLLCTNDQPGVSLDGHPEFVPQ